MKILLFGKNGQVGWELQRSLAPLGRVIAVDRFSQEYCGDITDTAGITQIIRAIAPDVIVNAVAYTAVDKAENEPVLARQINAEATAVLAHEAKRAGAWLIHYSTDYVFDGSGSRPWLETDNPAPLNVYGQTKLEGEVAIRESGCLYLIFRTSWVYATRGNNFIKSILRLANERDELTVINDQIGAPTGADYLSDTTAHTIMMAINRPEFSGLYHLVAEGEISWHGYARFIINFAQAHGKQLKLKTDSIVPVPTSSFNTPAKRPHNSRLSTDKFQKTFRLNVPQWQIGVSRALTEILEQ